MKKWIAHLTNVERFRPFTMFGVGLGVMLLFYVVSGYSLWGAYSVLKQSHNELNELRRLADAIEQSQDQRQVALSNAAQSMDSFSIQRFRAIVMRLDTAIVSGRTSAANHSLTPEWVRMNDAHQQLKTIEEGALFQVQTGRGDSALHLLSSRTYFGGLWSAREAIRSAGRGIAVQRAAIGDIFLNRIIFIGTLAAVFLFVLTGAWAVFVETSIRHFRGRKEAEDALRESEEKYRTLIDALPHAVIIIQNYNVVFSNPASGTMFGTSETGSASALHRRMSDFIAERERERLEGFFTARIRGEAGVPEHYTTVLTRLDGEEFPADVYVRAIIYNGQPAIQTAIYDITERQRAEEALRESEERFRNLADMAPVLIWMAGAKRHTYYFNRTWLNFTGRTVGQEYGLGWQESVHPDDLPRIQSVYENAFSARNSFTIEYRMRHADNTYHWVLDTGVPRFTQERSFTGYIGSCIDITARKDAEQALRDNEERFRLLYNQTPVMMHSIDRNAQLVGVSDYWLATLGYERKEVLGRRMTDFLTPSSRCYVEEHVLPKFFRDGAVTNEPYQFVKKNGEVIETLLSATCERDGQGQVSRSYSVIVDVTERKRMEAERESAQQMLRMVLDNIPVRVFWKDQHLQYLGCNINFALDAGLTSPEEIIGKDDFQFPWLEQAERYRNDDREVMEAGVPKLQYEEPQAWPDGTQRCLNTSKIPLRDLQGRVIGVMGTYEDITARRNAEEALHKRLEFESLISKISTKFIHLTYDQIDAAIDQALAEIGQYAGVDRSYVFQFRADDRTIDNTHEWCAEGITSESYRMQNIAADDALPYFTPIMRRLDVFHVPRVRNLPPEAAAEKTEFEAQNIQSLICLPMHLHGQLLGFLGFDAVKQEQEWTDDIIALLRLVGEMFVNALDRKRSDEALHRQAEIMDQIHDSVVTTDLLGRVLFWNKGAERLYGYTAEEVIGRDIAFLYPDMDVLARDVIEPLRTKGRHEVELRLKRKNGEEFDAHLALTLLEDHHGTPYGMNGYSIDITERKQAETALHHYNRALRMISDCNQTLVRTDNEAELLQEICRIIVETGGYRLAFVGQPQAEQEKAIYIAAHAGSTDGFFNEMCKKPPDGSADPGPVYSAMQTGQERMVRDISGETESGSWKESAWKHGYRATIGLPLSYGGNILGGLGIFASEPDAFPEAEMDILRELANDIAYGIFSLRLRSQHDRARQAVIESEGRYRTLFETMGQGVVYQDRDGHIINANRSAERILGLSLEQMRGRTSADRRWRAIRPDGTPFPGETHPSAVALLTGLPVRNIAMGVYNQNEERYRWIEIDAVPQFLTGGTIPDQAYTIFSDITERKEAEEALRQSEERFRLAFHTSPDAININRLSDGIYVDVNEGFTQTTGFTLEDVAGKSSLEINIWDNPADRIRLISGLREGGVVRNMEARFRMKDGRVRTGLMSARIILLNGEPHILSITRDIDELKKAEEALRESEERYRNFVRNATEGIYRIDFKPPVPIDLSEAELIERLAQSAIVGEVNDHLARMYGLTPDEIVGRPATDLAPEYGGRALLAVRAPNFQVEAQETEDVDAEGHPVYLIENFTGLVENGHLIHIWGMQSNITARKRAEEERRRAEEALRLSEERFSKAFAASPISIAVTRMSDGVILDYNEAANQFFEFLPDEARGKSTVQLGLWKHLDERNQMFADLQAGKSIRDREYEFVTRKGKFVIARYSAEQITLNDEPCLLSTFVDVTERKRAEEAIRESEARYRLLADNVSDIISRHDLKLNYLYLSPAVRSMGYEVEELIGTTAVDLIHPDDRPSIVASAEIILREKKDMTVEYRFRRKDGSYVWVESSAHPIFGEDGEISEFIVAGRDISARKRAEAELLNQRWRLESIIEGTHVGTWEWNVQTGETVFNETWAQLGGYTLDELSPIDVTVWERLTHPDDLKKAYDELHRHFSGELPYYDCELRMKHKDGHWMWIHDRGRVITFTADGKPLLMFGTHTDITERKRSEETLLLNESRLETLVQLNQMKAESLQEIALFSMEEAVRLTQSTIGYVAFANEDESELTMYAWSNEAMRECLIQNKPLVYKVAETGLWGEAVRQRQAVITNDYAAPNPWKKGYPEGHVPVTRHMNVPIFDDGKIVIVAGVGNKSAEYNESDVRQLRLLMEGMWRIVQRKKAEDALRESEERYRNFILNASEGIYRIDLVPPVDISLPREALEREIAQNAIVGEVNTALAGMYGLRPEEMVGRKVTDFAPNCGTQMSDLLQRKNYQITEREEQEFNEAGEPIYIRESYTGVVEVGKLHKVWGVQANITERKRAEEAARREGELVARVMETSPVGITVVDRNGRITFANQRAEDILGLSKSELLQRHYSDPSWHIADIDGQAFPDERLPFRIVHQTGKPVEDIQHSIVWPDGRMVKLSINASPQYDENGDFSGIVAALTDITERTRAEEELRESEARLRAIIDEAPFGAHLYEMDADDRLIFIGANAAADRILGLDHSQFIRKSIEEAFPGLIDTDVPETYRRVARTGERQYFDQVAYDQGLIRGAFEVHAFATGPKRMAVFFRDITEHKRAEEELARTQQLLDAAFEQSPVPMVLVTIPGMVLRYVNSAAARFLAIQAEEYRMRSLYDVDISWKELKADGSIWTREEQQSDLPLPQALQGIETKERELELLRADGQKVWELASGAPIRAKDGTLLAGLLVMQDITERKHTEEALRDREARLSSIFRAAPVGIGVVVNRVFTEANETIASMTGYTVQELIGRNARMLYPTQEEYDFVGTEKYRQIREHGVGTVETRWVRKDGVVLDILLSSSPIVPDDFSAGLTFTALDITERKKAAEALAESEQRFRMIAENAHDIIWTTDAEFKLTYVSPAISGILGLKEDDVLGQSIMTSVAPGSQEASLRFLRELVGDAESGGPEIGGVSHIEHEVMAADGSRVWMEVVATALRDASGKVVGIQGISRDVTERRQAEDVVRRERDRAQMYLDLADVIMVALNNRGEITLLNKTGCRILGYEENDLLGCNWFNAVLPESVRSATKDAFQQLMNGDLEPVRFYENPVMTKSGEERLIEWRNTIIYDEFGHIMGSLSSGSDITERKRTQEELAARAAELERSNTELERFAYVASHDLQEPLRMMASYAQLLDQRYRGRLDGDADDFIGFITSGADRMRQLIHDLLTFSRVDTRGKPFGPVDCEKILQDVLHNLHVTVEESGVEITHDPLPTISADDTQMTQLFQNLISNAVKFRGTQSPHVHIAVTDDEHWWEFSVQDNGIGIESKYFERIFVIFQRLHGQKDHPGTGIGLAICRKIVERHGGRIWVESKPGQGSTFHFALPKHIKLKRRTGSHGSNDHR